jgi:hypothetical protein
MMLTSVLFRREEAMNDELDAERHLRAVQG